MRNIVLIAILALLQLWTFYSTRSYDARIKALEAIAHPQSMQQPVPSPQMSAPEQSEISAFAQMITDGKASGAVDGLLTYIKANDGANLSEAYYVLGKAYMQLERYDQAGNCFMSSYKQYPNSLRASKSLLRLAQTLKQLEKFSRACFILDRLDREYPNRSVEERQQSQILRKEVNCE